MPSILVPRGAMHGPRGGIRRVSHYGGGRRAGVLIAANRRRPTGHARGLGHLAARPVSVSTGRSARFYRGQHVWQHPAVEDLFGT